MGESHPNQATTPACQSLTEQPTKYLQPIGNQVGRNGKSHSSHASAKSGGELWQYRRHHEGLCEGQKGRSGHHGQKGTAGPAIQGASHGPGWRGAYLSLAGLCQHQR